MAIDWNTNPTGGTVRPGAYQTYDDSGSSTGWMMGQGEGAYYLENPYEGGDYRNNPGFIKTPTPWNGDWNAPDWTREAGTTPGSGWDAVQRDYQKQGIGAVAGAQKQGLYGDYSNDDELGKWIAARQREANDNNDLFNINHLTPGGVASAIGIGLGLGGVGAAAAGGAASAGGAGMTAADIGGGMVPAYGSSAAYSAGIGTGMALPAGMTSADMAAGMLPQYGTPSTYSAGIGGETGAAGVSSINYNGNQDYDNASGGGTAAPQTSLKAPTSETGSQGYTDADVGGGLDPKFGTQSAYDSGIQGPITPSEMGTVDPVSSYQDPASQPNPYNDTSNYPTTPTDNTTFPDSGETSMSGPAGTQGMNLSKMMDAYKMLKDPMALGMSLNQVYQSKQHAKAMQDFMAQQQGQGFPHSSYNQMAADYMDPTKRMAMLQSNPAYQASENFLMKDQQRKLAAHGNFGQLGQGGAMSNNWAVPMADVVGKNASNWDNMMFGQIKDASGMGFNNQDAQAKLASGFLPAMYNNQAGAQRELGNAIQRNMSTMPDMLKQYFNLS